MDHVPMNLVLFDDAIEHLTRVHRVIRMEKGHALLVGVGGSGKQSLTKLGAFSAGCEVFEITLTRGYDENSFREDLKGLYSKLGLENKKMVFLFTDAHVAQEGKIPKRYWHINTINHTNLHSINVLLHSQASSSSSTTCSRQEWFLRYSQMTRKRESSAR